MFVEPLDEAWLNIRQGGRGGWSGERGIVSICGLLTCVACCSTQVFNQLNHRRRVTYAFANDL